MAIAVSSLDTRWPVGPLQIDRSDPIMDGIDMFVAWNSGGRPADLAKQQGPLTLTSTPGWRASALGPGGYATGGSSYDTGTRNSIATFPAPASNLGFTYRLVGVPITFAGGGFNCLLDTVGRTSTLMFNNSGVYSFGSLASAAPTGLTLTPGQLFDIVGVGTPFSPFRFAYYNLGLLNNATTWSGMTDTGALSFGRNTSGGGANGDCVYYIWQQWTRALSFGEIWRLRSEPYAGAVAGLPNQLQRRLNVVIAADLPCGAIMM